MSTELAVGDVALAFLGVLFGCRGWRRRERHWLVTETETTAVRDIDAEGTIELEGRVADPADDAEEFVSPIGRESETVLAAWEVEEWSETGDYGNWNTLASGLYAEPFVVEDDTGGVQA